jgi:2-octaprenyl-6-methoxyphenol hydroxylase
MANDAATDCDVLIVGGGLVGSLLANALARLPLKTILVEARRVDTLESPSFDGRATALANGSQRVLEQLGLWDAVRHEAEPIRFIHIGERGRFGAARIDAREEGVDALGYTVENRVLGRALWEPLAAETKAAEPRFSCVAPAEVVGFDVGADTVSVRVAAEGEVRIVRARLMVAADGARSKLREALGISARVDDYEQAAIIVNCTTEEPPRSRAFERFTASGPIAVLPLPRGRVAIIWTQPAAEAQRLAGLGDDAFRDALQSAFGWRLGAFERVGRRDMHPLARVRSDELVRERTVLIGNAAVALHPVAGQGFNLALRDVAALAEVLADGIAGREIPFDPGNAASLDAYRRWRASDQKKLAGFTHALVQGFGTGLPGLGDVRGLSLMAFDLVPGAKSLLARHTMGLAGRVPRLARHLGLV